MPITKPVRRARAPRTGVSGRWRVRGLGHPLVSHPVVSALTGAGLVYLTALALAPGLPPWASAGAALAALAFLAVGWTRMGREATLPVVAALWFPAHLLLVSTGGIASPLLPLVVLWTVGVARRGAFLHAAILSAGAALLLLAGDVWTGGLRAAGVLEAGAAAGAGLLPAWWLERVRRTTSEQVETLEQILAEVGSEGAATAEGEAARRLEELREVLDRMRRRLGAARATLWDVDVEADRVRPWIAAGGPVPPTVRLSGDPLHWAWDEGLPLQLDSPPRWARDDAPACAVALEQRGTHAALLTVECEPGQVPPEPAELKEAAAFLKAFVRMQKEEARAVASREYYHRVLDLLRTLPREVEPEAFARRFAESARALGGGTGAAVGRWRDGQGTVVAVVGEDGGPRAGDSFGSEESEFALVARNGAPIRREGRRPGRGRLPLATAGERWYARPRALLALPLRDATRGVVGVLGVWSSEHSQIGQEVQTVLEAVAPFAGLQLDQLERYHTLREHTDRDPLTGLYNRRAFNERLASEAARFDRYRRPLALLLLDIDHFKAVNDTYGHEAGDAALRAVAEVLASSVREADVPARYGGEEFAVLLPETRLREAHEVAERIRERVEAATVAWDGTTIPVRASVGVSACPECVEYPPELVGSADAALYESKAQGRNRVTVAERRTP